MTTIVVRRVGFLGTLALLLTGLFVAGKVFGFLTWSWWLVFLPTLIYVAIPVTAFVFVIALFALVIGLAFVGLALFVLFLLGRTVYNSLRRKIRNYRGRKAASQVS